MSVDPAPLVSIIMAVKDTEPYLPACLDSILAQTYPHWELLAVNDHSTDGTPQILRHYAKRDDRIRVFDSEGHRLIPALQTAYRHVRGSLINRMDSDDRMPADKLMSLVEAWLPHGKGTVIAGGTEHFVDEGEVGDGFRRYEAWLNEVARSHTHYQEIYQECVIPSHSWILHKEDMDRVGAFDPLVYPEDYDLCFRFYRAGLRVVGLDKVLHHWRDRSERISRTWEEYRDNRYFDLKLRYFYELDRDLGCLGDARVDLAGDLEHLAAAFATVDDAFVDLEMTKRGIIDQQGAELLQHVSTGVFLAVRLEPGDAAEHAQHLLTFVQQLADHLPGALTTV